MPDGAGTHESTGEGVAELVIALPHGGSVAVQFSPYLVTEHPIIRGVLCSCTVGRLVEIHPHNPIPDCKC